nr:hypothetical protein [Tanacetum cinerariifolium]
MQTRSSSKFVGETSTNSNPKGRNCTLEESPVVTMADQRTMAELLRAPIEGYAEAIVVPPILIEHFEIKHSLINLYKDVPETSIKLMLFPFSIDGPAWIWLDPRSILTWDDLVPKFINHFFPPSKTTNLQNEFSNFQQRFDESFYEAWDQFKDLLRACPHHGFTELHQLDTFYNGLNPSDQDYLNSAVGSNLLERSAQDVLKIIENKSKIRNSRNKPIFSQAKEKNVDSSEIASAVTSAMTAMFKQHQVTPALAFLKAVEESCVTCGGVHSYRNGNTSYQALIQQTQVVTSSDLEKFKKTNEANMQAMRNHISNLKSELRSKMQSTMQNQNNAFKSKLTNDIKNMMDSFSQMNTTFTSGSGPLPSNTIANPKGELKAITTRSGSSSPNIPYPSRMYKEKQQDKDEVQIHKFWQMFKQLHINITLADALIIIPKYQKMLKALLSNKEKLLELANTPLNENFLAVILKKLPEKLGDPGKFLIPCGFSELKCKALADLGASINLMPLSVWKKLGLPELISTRITLELANRSVCTPDGIAKKCLCSGRKGEELILCDGDERLILNMKHDTPSYFNNPQKESIHMIDIYNISYKDYFEDLFVNKKLTNHLSGNPTFSSEPKTLTSDLTSPEVKDDIFDSEGDIVLIEKLLNLDSTKDPPYHNINPLSGNTTFSSPSLTTSEISDYSLEEFADELALIDSFSPKNDDMTPKDVIREIEYLLNRNPLAEYSPNNDLIYTIPEMFIDEHTLDYSSLLRYDDTNDDLFDLKTDNDECILVHENLYEVTNRVAPDKNVKKISSSNASLILEDYNSPLSDHELPFHIEIPGSGTLLSFLSKNEEKVFNHGILISKGVHSLLPELSHRDSKAFKVINIFESPMKIFPCSYTEDIRVLDVPCLHFYPS